MLVWFALVPLMFVALAVALVPVTVGIIHDQRARNTEEHSHLFFVPTHGTQPVAQQGFKSEVEERLVRVEALLAEALGRRPGERPEVATSGSEHRSGVS